MQPDCEAKPRSRKLVQRDLEAFRARVVTAGDTRYPHVEEGADDRPAHIKGALTQTHLSIPLMDGRLALGTWQGIFLWEHRHRPSTRRAVVNLVG